MRRTFNRNLDSTGPSVGLSKDLEYQVYNYQDELEYPSWYCKDRLYHYLHSAPDDPTWNSMMCVLVLAAIVWVMVDGTKVDYIQIADIFYNIIYALHVLGIAYNTFVTIEKTKIDVWTLLRFAMDFATFFHYVLIIKEHKILKTVCYFLRLHRPFHYLCVLSGFNLSSSVLGTSLKYIYIFAVMRIAWTFIWLQNEKVKQTVNNSTRTSTIQERSSLTDGGSLGKFVFAFYIINSMFVPMGPEIPPTTSIERLLCMVIMVSGCLIVTGMAIASLSLVLNIYLRPEEAFRARYRLIMKEMSETNVPASLRQKVESFYRMYWLKQRAVSKSDLLREFPPIMPTLINTDIYFEATQRTRILRDLSFEFLSELTKRMTTTNYIPGDAIIMRNSVKSSIIFITYGDVEMLTAEDDSTPILRMTRGTVLSPYAGSVSAACAKSHVMIRAASFCTTHELDVADLWRVARKFGKNNLQADLILEAFTLHFENVKRHYNFKFMDEAEYKSSIYNFKHNLRRLTQFTNAEGKVVLNHKELFLEIANSYFIRNLIDTTDESDAICLKSTFPCILQPDSSLQAAWQIVASCCTVVAAVMIPYNLVFVATPSMEYEFFSTVVNVVNIIDLFVHLSTGAHVEEGVPINFMQTASQQMGSVWFFLDVAAILPIFYFIGDGHFEGINKLLKLPKVFRNLKSLETLLLENSNKMRLLSFTLLVLILCFLIATLQQGFMCYQFDYCVVTNFTHSPFWAKKPLDDDTVGTRVIFSLFWAISIMTFTSHLKIFEESSWEYISYALLLVEMITVLRIFMTAIYAASTMVTTFLRDDYDYTITKVKNFMIRNDIDPQMRKRFTNYLELCWCTDKAYSMTNKKKSIFHDLPPHVYQEIVSRKRSKYILHIPFMKLIPRADLKTISSDARLFYTSPKEILMNTGDIINEMIVIKQGMCEKMLQWSLMRRFFSTCALEAVVINPETREVVALLSAKGHFGAVECILRLPAFYTVRAVTHVQVFSISKKKLEKLREIPQIKHAIKFAKNLPEYRNLQRRRESFLFYEPPRPTPNREKFRLPKKYELDTDFQQPFTRLGVLAVLRYVFPRFTIRPDCKYLERYELFRGICAMLSAMICTSYTYLVLQWPFLYYVLLLLDMTAYYDMFQRMLVGYYNEIGILVYHPAATSAYYLKGTFIVDLLASIPMEFLESELKYFSLDHEMYRLSEARQMLMMNRLLQLYRLPSALKVFTNYFQRRDAHLVINGMLFVLALLNVFTCYMIFNSAEIYFNEQKTRWKIVPFSDPGGSWITMFNVYNFNITETPWNFHLPVYLWMVYATTSIDDGAIVPSNFGLMRAVIICMIIGTMVIMYISVSIISIRASINKELAYFREDLKDMIKFMRKEDLDEKLQKEVLAYYEYNWEKMGGIDYNNILKLCDQITLRTDAILHIYGPTFAKCPFLMKCDISLLRILGREVTSLYLLQDMRIFEVDDVISDMFFLVYGTVQIRVFYSDRTVVTKLQKGSVFGNLDQTPMVRSQSTAVALTRVHVLPINSYNFHRILADFPRVHRVMAKCRAQNKNFIANLGAQGTRSTKERISVCGSMLLRGRRGIINHLYFKDKIFQNYLIVVSLVCVYLDLYNAGFQDNSILVILILYAMDLAFYMKILLQYSLPYLINTENLRKVLLPMRKTYFKGEFRYDLVSCIPIELFCLVNRRHRWLLFSWLRLNRLFRMVTAYKCLKRQQERLNINLTLTSTFTTIVYFSLFVHASCCVWFFIGTVEDAKIPGSSWLHKGDNGTFCNHYYVCSLYFTLTTFALNGVGDVIPKNHSEILFVCVFQLVALIVFMVYVGEVCSIIQYQSVRCFGFYCKYLELQHFLANNRVSKNLVNVVNKYSLHIWKEARGLQVPHFLDTAPPAIKLKVMAAAYMAHLQNHIVFEACEPAFLRQLVGKLKMYYYNRDMFVVKEGQITDSIYIVHTGRVQETSSGSGMARIIIAGGSFGLVEGLFPDTPFSCSYKSVLKCQILSITFKDWSFLLSHFPKSADSIYDRLDFDDSYGPHKRPKFDQIYQPQSWEETEFMDDKPESKPPGESKTKSVETNIPSARRPSTPFAVPMKDIGSFNLLDSNLKSSNSDTPSELELTNISLTDQPIEYPTTSKEVDEPPNTESANVQNIQTSKHEDSSDTTATTDPSTVSDSMQESMDLTKKKNDQMQRNESLEEIYDHEQDINKNESLEKDLLYENKVEDPPPPSLPSPPPSLPSLPPPPPPLPSPLPSPPPPSPPPPNKVEDNPTNLDDKDQLQRVTTSTFVGPLNSRNSDEAIPLPTTPLAQVGSQAISKEKIETPVPKNEPRKEPSLPIKDKEKSKIQQTAGHIDMENDDDIDQDQEGYSDKTTSGGRVTRRLVHVRYEEDSKSSPEAGSSNPPEIHESPSDESPSTSKKDKNKK